MRDPIVDIYKSVYDVIQIMFSRRKLIFMIDNRILSAHVRRTTSSAYTRTCFQSAQSHQTRSQSIHHPFKTSRKMSLQIAKYLPVEYMKTGDHRKHLKTLSIII